MASPTQREEGPAMAVADEIEDQSPIEEVRLTIPTTDDTTLPTLTFRTWVLGISSFLPLAKLMAKTLPTKPIRIPFTKWKFSMNPGPFNMKEHALIYTLTSSGYAYPSGLSIVTQMQIFYHHKMNYWITFLVIQTTQVGTPIAYWTNWYNTRRFPMISTDVYDKYGQPYNTSRVAPVDFFIQIIAGYLYSGRPLENLISQTYGQVALNQATLFINDFKLCHYMKIPPRSMFLVQVLGTMISTSIKFSIQWYILSSVKNICEPDKLPKGSNWTCPSDRNYFMSNIIWGLVGPSRVFYPSGPYSKLVLFFIVGAISPVLVWMLARSFPHKKWITLINIPLIFVGASTAMPPVTPINYWSWFFVGIIFNHFVYRRYKGWWAKYNYVLSNALDAGCAFMAFLLTGALQSFDVYGISWWGLDVDDHCPLASCPTAPGVVVDGCPVFQ
ncbi:Oligopeptide transporter 5 [Acorus gramineus]|uniref:Oligopeptide transporter 5 n=1 Tax=Acorus gramineus TaxID=55184 RepID=A0AAV9AY74_ACOGR|nr:Oligopeptide transporter 5 [Acorus gramineus]